MALPFGTAFSGPRESAKGVEARRGQGGFPLRALVGASCRVSHLWRRSWNQWASWSPWPKREASQSRCERPQTLFAEAL
jgi:hypothetical protein